MQAAMMFSSFSKCGSRQVGAVLVQDGSVVSQGYNGSPRGSSLCQDGSCRRRDAGHSSGEGLHLCPAVHAEANCLVQAARNGVCTKGGTLYLYAQVRPCRICVGLMINAGVKRLVVLEDAVAYDDLAELLLFEGPMEIDVVSL